MNPDSRYLAFTTATDELHRRRMSDASSVNTDPFRHRHCFVALATDTDSYALFHDPDRVRAEISRLLKLGRCDAAIDCAARSNDEDLYRDTAVNCHRLRIQRWRAKRSRDEDCVLPCRAELLKAANTGKDELCCRLLEMLYRRSSNGAPLDVDDLRELVMCTADHWMLQTAYKMREHGLLGVVDVRLFERILDHSFLPLIRHLATTEPLATALVDVDDDTRKRIASKYTHCALRFCIRQSKDLSQLREIVGISHISILDDQDFVNLCRYTGLLSHMTDTEIADRRRRAEGSSDAPLDRLASANLFEDVVTRPWCVQFQEQFACIYSSRMAASMESVILKQFVTLPVLLSPRSASDVSRAA